VAPHRNIPLFLSNIALKCLAPSLAERYKKVEEILQDFEKGKSEIKSPLIASRTEKRVNPTKKTIRPLKEKDKDLQIFEKKLSCFPQDPVWQKRLCDRLQEVSKESRASFYPFALLAARFLTSDSMSPEAYTVMHDLKHQLEPFYFIDEKRLAAWPESVHDQALAVHLAFLLAKPQILSELFDVQCKKIPAPLPIIGQILMALIKLDALELGQQKLDAITQQFLDVQAIAFLGWIQEALDFHREKKEIKISFLSELPKKIILQHLLPLFLILDEAICRQETNFIIATVNHLIMQHDLETQELAKLDAYLIWAYLLDKNWTDAGKILNWYLKKRDMLESLQFLYDCWLFATEGTPFSLPKINPDLFLWEKRELYNKYILFYNLSNK
jgi:hypothetical protein